MANFNAVSLLSGPTAPTFSKDAYGIAISPPPLSRVGNRDSLYQTERSKGLDWRLSQQASGWYAGLDGPGQRQKAHLFRCFGRRGGSARFGAGRSKETRPPTTPRLGTGRGIAQEAPRGVP